MYIANANIIVTNATWKFFSSTFLRKHSISCPPRSIVWNARNKSANVVVFRPPAVPPGEPPINIKIIFKKPVSSYIPDCWNVLNPAVLVVTAWNAETINFCPVLRCPIVAGLWYSSAKFKTVPAINKNPVVMIAIFECNLSLVNHHFLGISRCQIFFPLSITSYHTVKPIPPRIINSIVIILIKGSVAYLARLSSPRMSIPALQNAEIEWKIPYQIPFATP